jgi:hypothetical protein
MRWDIYDFFKDNSEFKIAEIGSYKGYSTKILSKIFSNVYAIDNNVEWTNFNKKINEDSTNIEYITLDVYQNSWDVLPDDIEVVFIDANHSYNNCRSDIMNSIKRFKNLKYVIFNYGAWNGVKQNIEKLTYNKILKIEKFIGKNNVQTPKGIINANEGIICSVDNDVKKIIQFLTNKTYIWKDSYITFLDNFKMDAFGEGNYVIVDKQTIKAYFNYKTHNIIFNDDYTIFLSIREDDLQIVNGGLKH